MAKIKFDNGVVVNFDGDPTPADIEEVANKLGINKPQAEKKSVGGFIKNIGNSGKDFVTGVASAIAHPIKTGTALGKIGAGAMEKIMPWAGDQEEGDFDAAVGFFKERYGSVDKLKETMYKDPVGFAADLSTVLSGGGAAVTKAGQASKISALAKTGSAISKTAQYTNPANAVSGAISKIAGGIGAGVKKAAAPFVNSFDSETADIAKKTGVDLPMSSLSSSKPIQIGESIASRGLFGDKLMDKIENAGMQIDDAAQKIVDSMDGIVDDPILVGEKIIKGTNKFKENWTKMKNELYQEAILPKGTKKAPAIPVNPTKSLEFLRTILEDKTNAAEILGNASNLKQFKTIYKNLSEGNIGAFKFKIALQELNKKAFSQADPLVVTGDRGVIKKLTTLMNEDLDNAIRAARPDLAQAIDKANDIYKSGLEKLNGSYGKAITRNADKPEKIVDMLMKKAVPSDIDDLSALIGKDAFELVRKDFVQKLLDTSKSNTTGSITKANLTKNINKNSEMLQKILSPEQYTSLKEVERLLGAYKQGLGVATGSQTAHIGKMILILTTIFTSPLIALKSIIGDKIFSKFMSSKAAEKWLTEGYKPNVDKAVNTVTPPPGAIQGAFQADRMEENQQ